TPSGEAVTMKNISLRIGVLSLINKTLSIRSIKVKKVHFFSSSKLLSLEEMKRSVIQFQQSFNLPFTILIKHATIRTFLYDQKNKSLAFTVKMGGKLKKHFESFRGHLLCSSKSSSHFLDLTFEGDKK